MRAPAVVAVDVGGTSIKGAVVADDGGILARCTRGTSAEGALDGVLEVLHGLAERAAAHHVTVLSAGVVSPGIVDETRGVVEYAANLDWRGVALGDAAEHAIGVPVAVGQDVRAAGGAEYRLGAADGVEDFALVPIGTGIAAAMFTEGRIVRGATAAAGEFGHMPVVPDGETCSCGQRGCLEVYSSAAGISRRYAARTGTARSAKGIAARLDEDADARAVWTDAVDMLGCALATLTLLMDPAVVVLAGGLSAAGDALLDPLRAAVQNRLAWRVAPRLARSRLGADAGVYGAALLAFDRAGHPAPVALPATTGPGAAAPARRTLTV